MSVYNFISADRCDQWMNALESCGQYDTYHLPEYHLLAKEQREGSPYLFSFQDEDGAAVLPMLIRRTADVQGLEDSDFFDATSVYGYPGVVTNGHADFKNAESFRSNFQKALRSVFHDKKIIAFFTRQNPLFQTSWLLQGLGDVLKMSNTVAIDLTQPDHAQEKNMTKGHRYDIRKAGKQGVVAFEDKNFDKIKDFIRIYNETMTRNGALEYYFFPESYYDALKKSLGSHLRLFIAEKDGVLVSAALFLVTGEIIQYHLSGTPEKYLSLFGAKIILDEVRKWGAGHGYRWLHLGGGLGSQEDSLFRFKSGFSKLRFQFEVIRAVMKPTIYNQLVSRKQCWIEAHGYEKRSDNYFPDYRAPIMKRI